MKVFVMIVGEGGCLRCKCERSLPEGLSAEEGPSRIELRRRDIVGEDRERGRRLWGLHRLGQVKVRLGGSGEQAFLRRNLLGIFLLRLIGREGRVVTRRHDRG